MEERLNHMINHLILDTDLRFSEGERRPLPDRMAHHRTPGVSIAVVHGSRLEWACGFGVREHDGLSAVDSETLFLAGSISKPVTAMAVMQLADQKLLDLDEDVNTCLTSWQVPRNNGWQPRITLRQILSHTAGLTVHGFPGYRIDEDIPTIPQILDGLAPANTPAVRVNLLPGTVARYSGGGTVIAQLLLTDLLGKPFPEIMRERVLDPLGMTRSTFEQPLPSDRHSNVAAGHTYKYLPVKGRWHIYPEMAAAGLWTTPSDLARVIVEIQSALHGGTSRILSKSAAEEMTRAITGQQAGLGFFVKGSGATARFIHGGWDEGFVSQLIGYGDTGHGAVIMVNANQGHALLPEIERAIAADYHWPEYFPEPPPEIKIDPEMCGIYTGDYVTESGMAFAVTFQENALCFHGEFQAPLTLHPKDRENFYIMEANTDVHFEKNAHGEVTGLTLVQEGQSLVAGKLVPEKRDS